MSKDSCRNNIYTLVALGLSLICMGDPREFYISCVNEHIPELQMEFGFAVSSKGNNFSTITLLQQYYLYAWLKLLWSL